jgi:hypothetical protein
LLRPSQPLRELVLDFERAHNLSSYTALLLADDVDVCKRRLHGGTASHTHLDAFQQVPATFMPDKRPVTLDDVCHMSDDYIAAALAYAAASNPLGQGKSHRVVLALEPGSAHGGGPAARARAEAIVKRYDAIVYDGPHTGLVEMQLLLRSTHFVGSLGPFSSTVAAVRDATLKKGDEWSNLRRRFPCD